jgi:F420-dependent oxidoreductase-like protein
MKLALHFLSFSLPGGAAAFAPTLAATARAADDGGFATMTVMDHWFQMKPLGGAAEPMLEAYSTLAYLAAITERIELGALVTGVTYRYPGLLAKTVATLDVLSGGRAMLGIGAAWYEEEHEAYGVPFPPLGERFERLTEALEICEQMWSDDDGPYDGRHYRLAAMICNPRPLRSPRPRILVGRRRAEDPAARGAARRRVQPLRPRAGRRAAQARGAAEALRRRRARLQRDPEDPDDVRRGCGAGLVPGADGGVRGARDRPGLGLGPREAA